MTQEEVDQLQSKALEQFRSGKSLFGKGGVFAPIPKYFLESAPEAEMDAHLDEDERLGGLKVSCSYQRTGRDGIREPGWKMGK